MKIVQAPPSSTPTRKRGVNTARHAGGFASQPQSGSRATGPSLSAPLTAVGSLGAVREVEHGGRERRLSDHGHGLLDELRELHLDLVDGWLIEDNLHRLANLVEQAEPRVEDRESAATLEDIELDAAVEPAKLPRRAS